MGADEDIREIRTQVTSHATKIGVHGAEQGIIKERQKVMGEEITELKGAVVSIAGDVKAMTGTFDASDVKLERLVKADEKRTTASADAAAAQVKREEANAMWWAKIRRELTPANVMIFAGLAVVLIGFLRGEYTASDAIEKAAQVTIPVESKAIRPNAPAPVIESPPDDHP